MDLSHIRKVSILTCMRSYICMLWVIDSDNCCVALINTHILCMQPMQALASESVYFGSSVHLLVSYLINVSCQNENNSY